VGCGVSGSGFRVSCTVFLVSCAVFRNSCVAFRATPCCFEVSGFGFMAGNLSPHMVPGFVIRASIFGLRDQRFMIPRRQECLVACGSPCPRASPCRAPAPFPTPRCLIRQSQTPGKKLGGGGASLHPPPP